MTAVSTSPSAAPTTDRTPLVVGWLVVAAGIGLAVTRFFGGSPPEQDLTGALGAAAQR